MANNPITVPLPQDLPETWAANQIVSPDGVSAGLTPQHGYNYLMQQVNNAQKAAQELGEGIAGLSGDNLPASSDGGETISTALSNKVKISALSGIDLNDVTVDGHYRTNGECTNVPITGGGWEQWTQLLVITGLYSDNTTQIMPIYYTGDVWLRTIKGPGVWTPWRKISIATPPQEYSLPLTEGFTPITPCTYRKNQFSEVFVGGSTGGTITDGTVIATLPEGFRPKQTVERPATFAVSGSQAAGSVTIMPDGNVSVHGQSAASGVVFSANFVVDE